MVDKADEKRKSGKPLEGAGAPDGNEIEITSRMIEVGVDVYLSHCPDTGSGDELDRAMVREIFAAMQAARPAPVHEARLS